MKYEINKERIWVFAPIATISTMIEVKGAITTVQLQKAISTGVGANEILKTRVVLEGEKSYFVSQQEPCYQFTVTTKQPREILNEEEKKPFDLSKGEYLRFFLLVDKLQEEQSYSHWKLLLNAHHIAGDGTSYAYLMQDILKALSGETLQAKPAQLFDMKDLPAKSNLNFPMKLLMKQMNRQWEKQERLFTFDEYQVMAQEYWKCHKSHYETIRIKGEAYQKLIQYQKQSKLKMNTILTTALCKAASDCGEVEKQDIGQAVSIRKEGYEGMGNFATGVSVQYQYDSSLSFEENGARIQKQLYEKLENDKKKFFLLQFMGNIKGSLTDAIYFSALQGFENKTAKTFSNMMGYQGNPKGISVTNLTRLPIGESYGGFLLLDYLFIPPLVLNAKRIFGFASLANQMEISLVIQEDESLQKSLRLFETVKQIINGLCEG